MATRADRDLLVPRLGAVVLVVFVCALGTGCGGARALTPSSNPTTESLQETTSSPLALSLERYAFLVVIAHPDDETAYLSGALTSLAHGGGFKGAILCLTSGGKGGNRNGWEMDEALEDLRERELIEAARSYGVDVLFARFADYGEGRSAAQIFEEYWDREFSEALVVGVLRALRPTLLVSMHPVRAPDSPAHRAASDLAVTAARLAANSHFRPELGSAWRLTRHIYGDGTALGEQTKFRLDVKRFANVHARAAAAHRSQWAPEAIPAPEVYEAGLLSGASAHIGKDLSEGIPSTELPRRADDGTFEPSVRRLYESPLGRQVRERQTRRHQAFLNRIGPHAFRFEQPAIIAPAKQPNRVDGELGEFIGAPPLRLRAGEKDIAELRMLWHRDGLGIGAEVLALGPPQNDQPLTELYRGDSLELFLNPRPSDAHTTRDWRATWDRQYIFAPSHAAGGPIAAGAGKTFALPNTPVAIQKTASGYKLESFVPASEFPSWPPKRGEQLRFDFGIKAKHVRARWHDTTDTGWFNPHVWGLAEVR